MNDKPLIWCPGCKGIMRVTGTEGRFYSQDNYLFDCVRCGPGQKLPRRELVLQDMVLPVMMHCPELRDDGTISQKDFWEHWAKLVEVPLETVKRNAVTTLRVDDPFSKMTAEEKERLVIQLLTGQTVKLSFGKQIGDMFFAWVDGKIKNVTQPRRKQE